MDGSAPSELHAGDRSASPAEEHTSEWPRISDYWPDGTGPAPAAVPERVGDPIYWPDRAGQISAAVPEQAGDPLGESTASQPVVYAGNPPPQPVVHAGDPPPYAGTPDEPGPTRLISPPPPPRRSGLRLAVAGVSAGVFLGVSVLVLTRLVSGPDEPPSVQVQEAAPPVQEAPEVVPPAPNPPVSIEPSPGGSARPTATGQAAPPFTEGTFDLVSDVVELNLAYGRPAGGVVQARTPAGSGITARAEVEGSTVKLSAKPNGRKGPARIDVLLDERVAWTLRTSEGATRLKFDLVGGKAAVEEVERRIGDGAAPPAVDAEGAKLGLHPTGPDPEVEASAGELLNRRHPLRRRERRAVGHDEDAGAQTDA